MNIECEPRALYTQKLGMDGQNPTRLEGLRFRIELAYAGVAGYYAGATDSRGCGEHKAC